jgi:microcystin-dependent protein
VQATTTGQVQSPSGNAIPAQPASTQADVLIYNTESLGTALNPATVALTGGGTHPNIQPYLCINFIIALNGLYPQRT